MKTYRVLTSYTVEVIVDVDAPTQQIAFKAVREEGICGGKRYELANLLDHQSEHVETFN